MGIAKQELVNEWVRQCNLAAKDALHRGTDVTRENDSR